MSYQDDFIDDRGVRHGDDDDDDDLVDGDDSPANQVDERVAELMRASVPERIKDIRACKRCGLLKTLAQFIEYGCENCPFLNMAEEGPTQVSKCTTAFFEGMTAVMDPRDSWAAKWIRVDGYLPGVYAIVVTGQFDRDIEESLENQGIRWRCRPSTATS